MSRCCGGLSVTSTSPIEIAPSVTSSSPAIIRSSVDFPHPDGPTSTTNSPSWISRSTASTAKTPFLYTFVTSSSRMPLTSLPRSPLASAFVRAERQAADEVPLQREEDGNSRQRDQHRRRRDQVVVGEEDTLEVCK